MPPRPTTAPWRRSCAPLSCLLSALVLSACGGAPAVDRLITKVEVRWVLPPKEMVGCEPQPAAPDDLTMQRAGSTFLADLGNFGLGCYERMEQLREWREDREREIEHVAP